MQNDDQRLRINKKVFLDLVVNALKTTNFNYKHFVSEESKRNDFIKITGPSGLGARGMRLNWHGANENVADFLKRIEKLQQLGAFETHNYDYGYEHYFSNSVLGYNSGLFSNYPDDILKTVFELASGDRIGVVPMEVVKARRLPLAPISTFSGKKEQVGIFNLIRQEEYDDYDNLQKEVFTERYGLEPKRSERFEKMSKNEEIGLREFITTLQQPEMEEITFPNGETMKIFEDGSPGKVYSLQDISDVFPAFHPQKFVYDHVIGGINYSGRIDHSHEQAMNDIQKLKLIQSFSDDASEALNISKEEAKILFNTHVEDWNKSVESKHRSGEDRRFEYEFPSLFGR